MVSIEAKLKSLPRKTFAMVVSTSKKLFFCFDPNSTGKFRPLDVVVKFTHVKARLLIGVAISNG